MLPGHDVRTVGEMGWAGRRNGDLLRAAEQQFDAFITVDRNIEYQQNISSFAIGIVLLRASTNDVDELLPLMPEVCDRLPRITAGELIRVGAQ